MSRWRRQLPASVPLSCAEEIAADWISRRGSGLTKAEERDLQSWLRADPNHRIAFEEAAATWHCLEKPRSSGRADEMMQAIFRDRAKRVASGRSRIIGFSLAGLAAAAGLIVAISLSRPGAGQALPATAIVKAEQQTLPDGSVVELNAAAQISTAQFTPESRTVILIRGEAHFAVAKDHLHPFVVIAGGVKVRAVGTTFDVLLNSDAVDVLVTEGKVRVDGPARDSESSPSHSSPTASDKTLPAASSIYVVAGERAVVLLTTEGPPTFSPLTSGDIDRALAWRSRRVEFNRAPLAEALSIFNNQNQLKIVLADPSLGKLLIGGAFWADDPEGFVRLLQSTSGLKAERMTGRDEIVLSRP